MEKTQYQIDYEKFLADYKTGSVSAERVGEAIVYFVQHFINYNLEFAAAEVKANSKKAEYENSLDASGKPISSAKAKVLAEASPEAAELVYSEVHIKNLEAMINGLKALQKALAHEFSHMS